MRLGEDLSDPHIPLDRLPEAGQLFLPGNVFPPRLEYKTLPKDCGLCAYPGLRLADRLKLNL
jgi:hypothetical protein